MVPGDYTVTISVTDHHNPPVSAQMTIHVLREETTTTYTGPTVIAQGLPVTLKAVVLEDGTTAPSPAVDVTLSVGSQSCVGTTDLTGLATCTIPVVTVARGRAARGSLRGQRVLLAVLRHEQDGDRVRVPRQWGIRARRSGGCAGDAVDNDDLVERLLVGPEQPLRWARPDLVQRLRLRPECDAARLRRHLEDTPGQQLEAAGLGKHPRIHGGCGHEQGHEIGEQDLRQHHHIVVIKTNPGYGPNPGHTGTGTIVGTYC